MEVEKGYTKLTVPHGRKTISAVWEPVKGTYDSCRTQLKERGLPMMTSPQLASFAGDAYEHKNEEFPSKILKIINDAYIRSSTESLWLPKNSKENGELAGGVIGYDNPDTNKGKGSIEKSVLFNQLGNANEIKIKGHRVLISKDGSVRWTPFGYETGTMNLLNLAKNPYNIVLHGEEGAEKIAEVASNYNKNPWLGSLNSNINKEQITTSALCGGWGFGSGLDVDGNGWLDGVIGHAFGVCKD